MKTPQDYRKTYLINSPFQLRLLGAANGVTLVGIVGLYLTMRFFEARILAEALSLGMTVESPFYQFLQRRQTSLLSLCAVGGLVFLALVNVSTLLISHRIAGPLLRLRKHLEAVAEGQSATDVRFRDGDFFPELRDACNRLMASIRSGRSGSKNSAPEHEAPQVIRRS